VATLRHEEKIRTRIRDLRGWAGDLAGSLRGMRIRTFPTRTYFFLADFSPLDAGEVATRLERRGILIRPLDDPRLGSGYMRVTTARPEDNDRFVAALHAILAELR
jgi:histidinol-phosphate aminotransferase